MDVFDIFEEMKPAFTAELLRDTFTEFFNADSKRVEQVRQFYKNGCEHYEYYTKDNGQTWYVVSAAKPKDTTDQLNYKIGQLMDQGRRRIITMMDLTIELPENSNDTIHCVNPVLHDNSLSTMDICELLSHFINQVVK